jgi:outer membrane protein assembly factor BamD (BamD/ComL family)
MICGCWEQFDYITVTNSGQVKFISKIVIKDDAEEFGFADIDEFSSGFLIDLKKAGWTVEKKWISKQRPYKVEFNGSGNLDKVATETAFYKMTKVSDSEYRIRFIPAESEGQKSSRTVTFKKINLKTSAYFYNSNGEPVETISNVQTDKQYVIAFDKTVQNKLTKQAKERGNLSDDERARKSIETYMSSYLDRNIKTLIEYDSHMYESIVQKVREVPKQLQDAEFEKYLSEKINKLKKYEQHKQIEGTIFDNTNTKRFFLQQAFGGGASPYDILYPEMKFEVMEIRHSSESENIVCQQCIKMAFVRLFYKNQQNAPYLDFTKTIKIKSAIIKIYLSKWSNENTGWVDYKLLHFQPTDHKRELFKIDPKQIERKTHEIFASQHTYVQKKKAFENFLKQYPNDIYTDGARAKITEIQNQIDDDAFSHALQNSDDGSKLRELRTYFQTFPDGRHIDEAEKEIEKTISDIEKEHERKTYEIYASRRTNTQKKQALEYYLKQYPNGVYSDEARAKIAEIKNQSDDDAFSRASQNSDDRLTVQKLENYLQAYPDGRHADEAKNEIGKIKQQWSKTKERIKQQRDDVFFKRALDEPDDLRRKNRLTDYMSRFPHGRNIVKANEEIKEIDVKLDDKAFSKAFNKKKSDRSHLLALEQYLRAYPNGRYVAKASMEISRIKSKMDDDAFAKAMSRRPKSRFKALEEYLKHYPVGLHAKEAMAEKNRVMAELDHDAYTKAIKYKSKKRRNSELNKYLDRFPDGIHREEANKLLKQN